MTRVLPWVVALVEKSYGASPFQIGDRVKHPSGRTVEIVSGQYWGTYGISNFWSWREVMPDGSLADRIESGYGWRAEEGDVGSIRGSGGEGGDQGGT